MLADRHKGANGKAKMETFQSKRIYLVFATKL